MNHPERRRHHPLGLWAAAVLLVIAAGCRNTPQHNPPREQRPAAGASSTTPQRAPDRRAPLQFIEKVTGGAEAEASLPWIVAIHGLGDRPASFVNLFDDLELKARVVVPRAPAPWGPGFSWFPYRSRDQDPAQLARGIETAAKQVAALIKHLRASDARFATKPIICGFSQGGMISYAVAIAHPDQIAGAIPISGTIPMEHVNSLMGTRKSNPPIRAMHGTADNVVPFAPTLRAVAELERKGLSIELQQYERVGHTISGTMRRQLYDWLAELQ